MKVKLQRITNSCTFNAQIIKPFGLNNTKDRIYARRHTKMTGADAAILVFTGYKPKILHWGARNEFAWSKIAVFTRA
jgi:hypothetical protein